MARTTYEDPEAEATYNDNHVDNRKLAGDVTPTSTYFKVITGSNRAQRELDEAAGKPLGPSAPVTPLRPRK